MEPWLRNVLILAAFCYECRGEDSVIQPPGDVIATEGEQVTLDCQFDTLDTNPYLFWYKQGANDFPKYMLRRATFGSDNAIEFLGRFDAHLNLTTLKSASKSFPLTIQRLQLSDSAVYYCALRPTVRTGYTAPLQKLVYPWHLCRKNASLTSMVGVMLAGMYTSHSDTQKNISEESERMPTPV
uniref:Ig-like domain-containing protein n=1 Tax=Oncorhynchus mykiss TaxID=8022 RepID=A0A8K9XH37_ONCMY